jgi:hypothetical protein
MKQSKPKKTGKSLVIERNTQLDLFGDKRFSNTLEIYSSLPQYVWGKLQREHGKYLSIVKRQFEHRGIAYTLEISPARIIDRNGIEKEYYPGQREELVEETLRKLMCEGQGIYVEKEAAVHFSLYQLENELRRTGHGYNKNEIKDALEILARTNIQLKSDDGSYKVTFHPIEMLALRSREDSTHERAFVQWNPLVTKSIDRGTFRQLNYEKLMAWRSVIARQLHKRMSHHYTQASILNTYHILLSTIIRDFGLTAYAQLRDNLRDVQKALDEMQVREVLLQYRVEKVFDARRKNRLADAKFTLTPHPRFVSEIIDANKRQGEVQKLLKPVENSIHNSRR